jgi:hypothetical protein
MSAATRTSSGPATGLRDLLGDPAPPRPLPHGAPARRNPAPRHPSGGVPDPRGDEPTPAPRVSEHADRVRRLAEASATADDPESALRLSSELRRDLAAGRSFGHVARALGISRQAAHRRFRDLAPARPHGSPRLVASEQARRVVRLAQAETLATRARSAGSQQLLLGILQTDSDAARALRSAGVTLEKARLCTRIAGAAGSADGDPRSLRRILRRARRVALARGDRHLRPEQLLLAAIVDADGGANRMLAALGASPDAIRARLRS